MNTRLTGDQVNRAYRLFYGDGLTISQVAKELGCGFYDLSPWLMAACSRIAIAAEHDERRRFAALDGEAVERAARAVYMHNRPMPADAWDRHLPESTKDHWRDYARVALVAGAGTAQTAEQAEGEARQNGRRSRQRQASSAPIPTPQPDPEPQAKTTPAEGE